ncbi:MAG: ABC transporter permease, partial [Pseudomonadota bacterium]
ETYQKQRADRSFGTRAKLYLKVLASKAGVDPILEVTGGIAIAGVLAFSAWRIVSGGSSIGDFLGFITLIAVAAPEVRGLGSLSASAQEARAAAERFYELVDAPRRVQEPAQPKPLKRPLGAIEFHNVTFG